MIAIVGAPSNLGLRPPEPGGVPGTGKAPEALREAGLHRRLLALGAEDRGVVLPGRYVDDDGRRPSGTVRNQAALVDFSGRLADRVGACLDDGLAPLVLGGDCSVLLGPALALARRSRCGLVHLDGHTDFRHPGGAAEVASVAGEDLAVVVGRHLPALSDIEALAPYVRPGAVAQLGARDEDADLVELRHVVGLVLPVGELTDLGPDTAAARAISTAGPRFWLHLDVDVLDPRWMPAVDSPDPGGLGPRFLVDLLRRLAPQAVGATVTILDPDLDPTGAATRLVADVVLDGLGALGTGST